MKDNKSFKLGLQISLGLFIVADVIIRHAFESNPYARYTLYAVSFVAILFLYFFTRKRKEI